MPSTISDKFRIHNAQQFKESFEETSNTIYYIYIGGSTAFTNDLSPPTPILTTSNTDYSPWEDMMALKRIQSSEVSHATKRYNWSTLTVYTAYDDKQTTLSQNQYYVVTDEYNVYKCLDNNNGGQSTIKPTGTGTTVFSTADGYVWKYMYSISTSDALKFLSTGYMPVKTLTVDDNTSQWDVQQAALDGAIHRIKVNAGGSGYVSTPNVAISGDGTGATATAVLTSNSVSSIIVNTVGTGYKRATVTISGGGGANAEAVAIISPLGGHGSDPVEELSAFYVMVNSRLDGTESSTFSVANDFRKIGLIRDPYLYGTTDRANGSVYRQTIKYQLSAISGTFSVDQTVTSGSNTSSVVEWDSSNNFLYCTQSYPRDLLGGASITTDTGSATVSIYSTPSIQPYSGDVLYIDNRPPINRASDQIENIKLNIEF